MLEGLYSASGIGFPAVGSRVRDPKPETLGGGLPGSGVQGQELARLRV